MLITRHGTKAYANGKSDTYQFDPPLTLTGIDNASTLGLSLLDANIDEILTSPYYRCIQTALAIQRVLKQFGRDISVKIEPLLAEYLGNQKVVREADLRLDAWLSYPGVETIKDLRIRVKKFTQRYPVVTTRKLIVTHGLVIRQLLEWNVVDIEETTVYQAMR